MKFATVKLTLLQQEAIEIKQGTVSTLDDTVSPTILISIGLELEEQQYVTMQSPDSNVLIMMLCTQAAFAE